jgi:hypothetical protein
MNCMDAYAKTTVYLRVLSTAGNYGEPTWATAQTVKARVEQRTRLVKGPGGENVVSTTQLYLPSTVTVGDTMQASLDNSKWYDALVVFRPRGLNGAVSHYEVFL